MSDRLKHRRPAAVKTEVLPPAVVLDANYLQGIALRMRTAIREGVLPGILKQCLEKAKSGDMEILFIPGSCEPPINALTFCEALQPELHRLGFQTEISGMQMPRLGMFEEKVTLAISWRKAA